MNISPGTLRRPVHLALAFAATFVVAIGMLAAWSARSDAAVICVPLSYEGDGCDTKLNTVQGALNLAGITFEGNEIRIAPGTYTGNVSYNDPSERDPLVIRGMGNDPGATTLQLGSTTGNQTGIYLNGPDDSLIANLRVTIPANADTNQDVGISIARGTVDEVVVNGPTATHSSGIDCINCTVSDSEIALPTLYVEDNIGFRGYAGGARIENSDVEASTGVLQLDTNGMSTVVRSRIKAQLGAFTDGGDLAISDSLFLLGEQDGAMGIQMENPNIDMGVHTMEGEFDGLTIINGAGTANNGIRAAANDGNEGVDATLTNSVIQGFNSAEGNRTISLSAGNGRTVKFHTSYSAYNNGDTSKTTGPNGGTLDYDLFPGHLDIEDGVSFADPGSGDFTPAPLSELLDAGNPADPGTGAVDILGNQRACHGTDAGLIRRDIGAFERKVDPNDDCVEPVTSILSGPQNLTQDRTPAFTFATDKNPGTYLCSWDGQPAVACTFNADAPDLGLGPHDLSVRTRDQFGNIDQTPEAWSYEVTEDAQPTCETDPSLCPKPDKTAPKVIGVKVAKKTKAKRVKVRFKSNEAGSTFRCKLNGAKWKKCKSPWKTPKLKKGKNTIRLQATDKAGNKSKIVKRVIKKLAKRK